MTRTLGTASISIVISAALIATLTACTITIAPPSAPTSTEPSAIAEEPSSSPEPEPEAEPQPLSLPGCADLITVAQAQSLLSPTAEFIGEEPVSGYTPWYQVPAVTAAVSALTEARLCFWAVPNSDFGFEVLVAKVDAATRATVEAALPAEGFASAVVGARTIWSKGIEGDYTAETHQFDGDLWIIANAGSLDITGVAADYAFESVRAANPTLGL